MNTEQKLYPFRLEEAKLNKGNVVTRDGRSVVYVSYTGDSSFPHLFRVDGRTQIYTENGRYLGSREDQMDLFMTTPPEDKPSTLTLPEILQLTNGHPPHREDWTRDDLPEGMRPYLKDEQVTAGDEMQSGPNHWCIIQDGPEQRACAQYVHMRTRRPAPPKAAEEGWTEVPREELVSTTVGLHKRLTTAEQEIARLTRERDEARLECLSRSQQQAHIWREFEAMMSRAESAEAQLAEAKTRIAELEQEYERSTNLAIRETNERNRLQKQLAAHTWTPTSERMPTKADGNHQGSVLVHGTSYSLFCHWQLVDPGQHTHWLPIPPLPTPPESEARAKAAYEKYKHEARSWPVISFNHFLIGWQASREGGGK